jgi:tRNA(Ile)-lysidine synthase
MPRPLPQRFAAHLHATGLVAPGEHVLVALSGGLDSVCLAHLLRFAVPELRLSLHAAHLDHALRPGSARDAQWVRGLARAWRLPLVTARAPEPPRGEAAARTLRYRFLYQAAAECGAGRIATAHHADDQLETLLFRLARGTGLAGLRGIPERRGPLVRPLLPFRRAELVCYARAARLGWREDESNAWPGFTRNRIRHALLPALEAQHPEAADRLLALAAAAREVEACWKGLLPSLLGEALRGTDAAGFQLARGVLREYHPRTRARVMRELARRLGVPLGRARTAAVVAFVEHGASGAALQLPGGITLERSFDTFVLRARSAPRPPDRPLRIEDAGAGRRPALPGHVGAWRGGGRGAGRFLRSFHPALPTGAARLAPGGPHPPRLRYQEAEETAGGETHSALPAGDHSGAGGAGWRWRGTVDRGRGAGRAARPRRRNLGRIGEQ